MSNKTLEFIKTAILKHGDKYDYSKVIYIRNLDKIIITCKIHGDFEQTPKDHKTGCGCPNCCKNKKMNVNDFINKANLVHNFNYDYSKSIYKNNRTKLTIICNDHGEFEQTPDNHLQGHGCSICTNNKISNTNDFINKAILLHGNKYDYSKVNYINNSTNITIICSVHGEFEQQPKVHLRPNGCSICSGNKLVNIVDFIKKANLKHNNKYDYSKVKYNDSYTKIIIICKDHGEFEQNSNHHLKGSGCPSCGGTKKLTTEEFIEKANLKHGGLYNYTNTKYTDYKTKLNIICIKHGEFQQIPNSHLFGSGCPKCSNYGYSNMQIHWLEFIITYEYKYIQHALNGGEIKIPGTKYKVDGYDMYNGTVYEFHGDYWHGNINVYNPDDINVVCNKTFGELYKKTKEREELIISKGFNLVVMWEHDWKKINKAIKILQRKFKNK